MRKDNIIEFNKNYTKLPAGIKTARLVACGAVRLQDLTLTFIIYDTEYREGGMTVYNDLREAYLRGENPELLLLCLISDSGAFFTTLRKDNSENREKYMIKPKGTINGKDWEWGAKYGAEFQIIIKEGV